MRWVPCVTRSVDIGPGGALQVAVGHPLVDEYLEFLTARARPNTRLAVAFDLKVFFSVVGTRLEGLVCHSDAGSQFTSIRYGERLAEIGALPALHRLGRRQLR